MQGKRHELMTMKDFLRGAADIGAAASGAAASGDAAKGTAASGSVEGGEGGEELSDPRLPVGSPGVRQFV